MVSCADRLWYHGEIQGEIKRSMDKIPPGWLQNLNAFCRYPQEYFSEDFEAIKRLAVTSYVLKSSKITDFAEAGWYVFSYIQKGWQKKSKNVKPKDVNMGKLLAFNSVNTYLAWGSKGRINLVDSKEYGWKPSDEGFIAIAIENN